VQKHIQNIVMKMCAVSVPLKIMREHYTSSDLSLNLYMGLYTEWMECIITAKWGKLFWLKNT